MAASRLAEEVAQCQDLVSESHKPETQTQESPVCLRLAAEARTLSWDSTACMFLLITVQPR